MSTLIIHDLARSDALDRQALQAVRGGYAALAGNAWLAGLGPVANVNVGLTQNITQLQNIGVNVLNNVGAIGPGFMLPQLNITPTQAANVAATI